MIRRVGAVVAAVVVVVALGVALVAKARADGAASGAVTAGAVAESPVRPLLLVMGDSIAAGTDVGGKDGTGFPMLTADAVDWRWGTTAVGGTGYVNAFLPGTRPYGEAQVEPAVAAAPDVVVVEGSENDVGVGDPADVGVAAGALYRTLQQRLPRARVVAVGPIFADDAKADAAKPWTAALRDAADGAGVPFIDPNAEGWLTRAPRDQIGPDGTHPTAEGHARIARLLGADLARLGVLPPAPGDVAGAAP